MSFVSSQFFIIVISTVVLYFLLPKNYRWYVLLAASGVFYYFAAGLTASLIMLASVGISYFAGLWIEKTNDDKKKKKLILSIGVTILLCILAITKIKRYADILSWVIIPLGISYYSFSLIGYLVDVYAKKQKAESNFLKFLLCAVFFLKVMQGPISKFRDIGPKLIEGHSFSYDNVCLGVQLIVWGYFKKLVISERTSMFIGSLFEDINNFELGGFTLIIATILGAVGVYCDFSGYMDIVTGISQIMGIELDKNFDRPFFTRSAAEFWRHWHMTLGAWFRDYVYMPLVINPHIINISKWMRNKFGKRAGKAVLTIIPTAVVWFLTGLWHGTGINFLVWGFYWGTIIIISNVFEPEFKKLTKLLRINTDSADWHIFQTIRTFCFYLGGVLISTLLGVQNLKTYFRIILKDFGFGRMDPGSFIPYGLSVSNFKILIFAVFILWLVEKKQANGSVRDSLAKMNSLAKWSLYALEFLIVILVGIYGAGYTTKGFAYAFF